MKSIEVNEKKWIPFCQSLEQHCRGTMVTVELAEKDGDKTIVENAPLLHIVFDEHADLCNSNLVIEAGAPSGKPVRHVVIEPIHIRLHNGNGGDRYNRLQILAENGTTTIHLKPGLTQDFVEGMSLQP
jgi:hypothetical protein